MIDKPQRRINQPAHVTLPPDLLERLDIYVKKLGWPRSRVVQTAIRDYLDANERRELQNQPDAPTEEAK